MNIDPAHLTDAAARNLAIKALRSARSAVRRSTTLGEEADRELDRLIKRKTRINASSLVTISSKYEAYLKSVEGVQVPLTDAFGVVSQF